ncbi:MAG TPA: hypothetical protein VH854_03530 [Thermoanaerobaculia bacterium]|nr:hypothetical protein [Thermoanaerobaculia bacterium]
MTLRRLALLLVVPAVAFFACTSHATPPPEAATTSYPASTTNSAAREKAFHAAVDALAHQINAPKETIAGVSQEEKTWPDSCLGCPKTGEMCAQVMTPGYSVVLRVSEATYEYHTDLGGTARLCGQKSVPEGVYPTPQLPPSPTPGP